MKPPVGHVILHFLVESVKDRGVGHLVGEGLVEVDRDPVDLSLFFAETGGYCHDGKGGQRQDGRRKNSRSFCHPHIHLSVR